MTDIASLGYEVDSSGLVKGEQALDRTADAAAKAGAAATSLEKDLDALQRTAQSSSSSVSAAMAEQEARLRAVAQRGVEYAESMRGGNLSERALAEALKESTSAFDSRAAIMAQAETTQQRMARRGQELQEAEARIAAETTKAARAHQLQELNLKKVLGQIDPTIAKLNQLAELEGTLEKALSLGVITPEVFQQYQGKIDATRAATLKAGQASEIMTHKLGGLNLQAVETQQSVAALVRSLATGRWGQAQASLTSITARTGIMSSMFSASGLAIGAAGAAVGAYAYALNAAEKDTSRLTNALAMTGNYANLTVGQVDQLVESMASLDGITRGGARNALISVAESGKIAGDQFEMVATIAARMEAATGQSIDKTVAKFEEIARAPVETLLKLNETEHFLTQAHLDRIDALIAEGDEQGAAAEAARIYNGRLNEVAAAAENARPHLQGMATDFRKLASEAWEGAKNIAEFLAATEKISAQRPWWQRMGIGGAINFMRDMHSAEPAAGGAAPAVPGALNSRETSERRTAAEEAERYINRQMEAVYGLDTAVNRLETSFGSMSESRQKALVADGSYTKLLNSAMEEDAKRNEKRTKVAKEQLTDEQRAAQRLQRQYDSSEASLTRQIALHGQVGRAAAMAYDTAHGALTSLSATQKSTLMELSQWLDWLDEMAALEDVWDSTAAEHKKAMDAGKDRMDDMTEYAIQAARNMQSHFADFLFDPFAEGTRGMGRAFSETIRRMLAEAASAKFFELIGTWASGYSGKGAGLINMIGGAIQGSGKREYGGSVFSRGMYQTGERNKPELLTTPNGQYLIPGDNGRVDPIRAAPTGRGQAMTTPQININLIGAPEGSTATARQNGSGGFDLDVIIKQVEGQIASNYSQGSGSLYPAVKNRHGLKDAV